MKTKIILSTIFAMLFLVLATTLTSAVIIKSISSDTIYPGQEGSLTITLKNDASFDITDVSMSLDFSNLPLTSVESSEANVDEILEGKTKVFTFHIKASNDAIPKDYNIPYTITYDEATTPKKGTIGITVSGKTDLEYTVIQTTNVIGSKGKVDLKIINKGTAAAKFVDVTITPQGFTLLSEPDVYIGTIDSDDFQTASFDVLYNKKGAILNAVIEYQDFDNKKITQTIELPLTVYTQDEAIKLGIVKRSNAIWIFLLIIIIVAFIIIRKRIIRKRKLKRNELMMR
jgi:hypothetical protein